MTPIEIVSSLKEYLSSSYPNIQIDAKPWVDDTSRLAIYFREEKFSVLYPMQRYHYIIHSIPDDFFSEYLSDTVWFELAPGEEVTDLEYPDEEFIEDIAPDIMNVLQKAGVFRGLDDLMAPPDATIDAEVCHGDFRHLKRVLDERGFKKTDKIDEIFDICHVLMSKGGYCDCEVLFNVAEQSRLKNEYQKRK